MGLMDFTPSARSTSAKLAPAVHCTSATLTPTDGRTDSRTHPPRHQHIRDSA